MKITAYYPQVFVNDIDAALREFEEIGFQRLHTVEDEEVRLHVLEINGNRVDLFTSRLPALRNSKEGIYGMHVNVSDFDEGVEFYRARGYRILLGPTSAPSMIRAILEDDQERRVTLFQHIKAQEA